VLLRILLLVLLTACAKERPPAPDDFDGLSHFIFTHWEDSEQIAEAMSSMGQWLETEGREEAATEFGFLLTDLVEEELAETPHPDHPLEEMIGVAVSGVSDFPITMHGPLLARTDQRWRSESTYIQYDRELTEGTAEGFVPPDGLIRTHNLIDKSGPFGIHIPYELHKDFRWVETKEGKQAIVAQSWVENEGCNGEDGDGKNCVTLSFSIDVWYGASDQETIRVTATWNYLKTSIDDIITEEFLVKTMVNGLREIFENTDKELNEG